MTIIINTNVDDLKSLESVAKIIAQSVGVGSVVCLTGDLGVGKTTFTKFLINNICSREVEVNSPTFNILQIYDSDINGKNFPIYHYDFYRLNTVEEVINLDLDYAVKNAITIIEWPEIADDFINQIAPIDKIIRLNLYFKNGTRFIQKI